MDSIALPISGSNDESQAPYNVNLPITVEFSRDGDGWLARRGDHAWLHGSFEDALEDTAELVALEQWGRR